MVRQIRVEPPTMRLEGASPSPSAMTELERTTRIELACASLAATLITLITSAFLVAPLGI